MQTGRYRLNIEIGTNSVKPIQNLLFPILTLFIACTLTKLRQNPLYDISILISTLECFQEKIHIGSKRKLEGCTTITTTTTTKAAS
jgi:hypothetical protein